MARRASVRYFKSRGAYFTTIQGKQHKLAVGEDDYSTKGDHGPNYTAAVKAHAELVMMGAANENGSNNTVRVVFEKYAEKLEKDNAPKYLKIFKTGGAPEFAKMYGEVLTRNLIPNNLTEFLRHLKDTTNWKKVDLPTRMIKCAFSWAMTQGLIDRNPFAKFKREGNSSSGDEVVVPDDVFDAVIGGVTHELGELLTTIRFTGCRPEEVYHLQAKDYDPEFKCVTYKWTATKPEYVWKNAKKTKRDRNIYLNDMLDEIIRRRIAERPTGYLFRTGRGNQFNRHRASWSLRKLPYDCTPYGLRHTYITEQIKNEKSIKIVADLCGTSVAMIEKTYSHLLTDKAEMRKHVI